MRRRNGRPQPIGKPSPGMYFWPNPVFEAVRCGEMRRDTAEYSGYSWIQLDTYGYSWIQWDTAGYSGSTAKCLDIDLCRDTAGYQGCDDIKAG